MLSIKKSSLEVYLDPLIKPLSQVNPNYLTLLGSIPPLLFFVFVLSRHYVWALIVFSGNFLDFVDGMVARKYHKTTAFGGFLDSVLDRLGDFFMISAFGYSGIVRWEIVVPLLFLSFLVSYTRSRGELASEKKVIFNIGLAERTERLILVFFALLLFMLLPTVSFSNTNTAGWLFLLLIILSCYTVIQRILFAYRKL